MRDYRKNKGRITDEGYALHCNVSLVTAAFAVGGIAAAAGTIAGLGAGVMAAGSVLGIKEAKKVGGLMMAGGSMVAGGAGLMAGGLGTLGTLSAGAQLVGGALQGVGILTGNNKLSNIGGLINVGGMLGTSMDSGLLSGKGGVANTADATDWGMMNTGTPAQTANVNAVDVNAYDPIKAMGGGDGGIAAAAGKAPGALGTILTKIEKYDKLINMAGGGLKMMNENKQLNDIMSWRDSQEQLNRDAQKQLNTAVAIPGDIGVSAPTTPRTVQSITPGNRLGLINAGQYPTGVVV